MYARKLGRFAGLVFVLAVLFGGAGAAAADTGGPTTSNAAPARTSGAAHTSSFGTEWE